MIFLLNLFLMILIYRNNIKAKFIA